MNHAPFLSAAELAPAGRASESDFAAEREHAAHERERVARIDAVDRITASYCADRLLGRKALQALLDEASRISQSGQRVPPDILKVIALAEGALKAG